MRIRSERKEDYEIITRINDIAFKGKKEGVLISQLRKKRDYKKELSLVAIKNDKIIGHLLLFPLTIKTDNSQLKTLSLGPIAVLPENQKQGVGKELVKKGIEVAKRKGFKSIIVIGHKEYYPKFGFRKSAEYKISLPRRYSKVPSEAFMILELEKDCLKEVGGEIVFPKEYDEAM
jgi:predicted N-acetyltransferase YhbS